MATLAVGRAVRSGKIGDVETSSTIRASLLRGAAADRKIESSLSSQIESQALRLEEEHIVAVM